MKKNTAPACKHLFHKFRNCVFCRLKLELYRIYLLGKVYLIWVQRVMKRCIDWKMLPAITVAGLHICTKSWDITSLRLRQKLAFSTSSWEFYLSDKCSPDTGAKFAWKSCWNVLNWIYFVIEKAHIWFSVDYVNIVWKKRARNANRENILPFKWPFANGIFFLLHVCPITCGKLLISVWARKKDH